MPKKLAKKVVRDVFETPAEVAKTAAEQVGVVPRKEGEVDLAKEELKKKEKEDKAVSMKQAAQIEKELAELAEKRKREKRMRIELAKEEKEEKKPKESLVEPKPKRPRGFLAGLTARLRKSRAEKAGMRISG